MKHKNVAVMGGSDLVSLLIIGCLSRRPIETVGGLVTVEMGRPAELTDLKQLIEIELVSNTRFRDLPITEERKVAPWPKDKLLVKHMKPNTKGFARKGVRRPGRR